MCPYEVTDICSGAPVELWTGGKNVAIVDVAGDRVACRHPLPSLQLAG